MRYRDYCGRRYAFAFAVPARTYQTLYQSRGFGGYRGASFGVRRPLRYLVQQLDLDESQTRKVAAVLNQLKVEREQVRLDDKRIHAKLADLVVVAGVSVDQFNAALDERVAGAQRLKLETAQALRAISEALDPDQRERFADLIRSGLLAF